MPPLRRSKRFKTAQDSQNLNLSSDNSLASALNPAKAVNTRGFPVLPDELYLEIISYYPVTRIPDIHHPDVKSQNTRRQVLFALSQTSLNLRRFFLYYLWQRIEVCRTRHAPMKSRTLALELVRQLEIVTIRDPALAKYVEIVNVEIGVYSRPPVLVELARCLALFPNLHTVQLKIEEDIIGTFWQDATEKKFSGYVYPTVRRTVVSYNALAFLKSCPQSRYVDSYEVMRESFAFWHAVAARCPLLEVSGRNCVIPVERLSGIASVFPELRNLTLTQSHLLNGRSQPVIHGLYKLKQLKVLRIINMPDDLQRVEDTHSIAEKLLLDLQRTDKEDKVLVLEPQAGKTKTFIFRYREPSPAVASIEVEACETVSR